MKQYFIDLFKHQGWTNKIIIDTIREILTNFLHHAVYHRGQVAREMRILDKEPAYTDYIAYLR